MDSLGERKKRSGVHWALIPDSASVDEASRLPFLTTVSLILFQDVILRLQSHPFAARHRMLSDLLLSTSPSRVPLAASSPLQLALSFYPITIIANRGLGVIPA